jgi:hypothetical protein
MHERDDEPQFRPSDEGHNNWLAMQSAYAEYKRACEALEPADELTDEHLPGPTLEDRQRLAFERYMESRIEFLESRFDETNPPGLRTASPSRAFVPRGPVVPILAAFLVCTVGFAWARERRQVRALETSRDELRTELNQTRAGLRVLAERMNAWTPPMIQPVEQSIPAAPPVRSAAPRAAVAKPHATSRRKRPPVESAPKNGSASRSMRARLYPERPRPHNPT